MIQLMYAVAVTFLLLVLSEVIWRRTDIHHELARKIVHMSVGTFVAFWPFFLSWNQIRLLSLAFVVVVLISQYLNIFRAIHGVDRPTWGEILFALATGLVTYITRDPYVYAAAILQMSLADGMAAVVGTALGKTDRYRVFGQYKSLAGSAAFLIVSYGVLVWFARASATPLTNVQLGFFAIVATLIENVSVRGLDNIVLPVFISLFLSHLLG